MSIKQAHPAFMEVAGTFELVKDCFKGEDRIKQQGTIYLPATASQELDGMEIGQDGYKAYRAYKMRAIFPEFVKDAVDRYQGILHQKPPVINLPKKLEPLLTKATSNGETLVQLLRRITQEQLTPGRVALVFDIDSKTSEPYISIYKAEAAINWDQLDGRLQFVVLDESGFERDGFQWKHREEYRLLKMDAEGKYGTQVVGPDFDNLADDTGMLNPSLFGRTLDQIPLVFINSKDTVVDPDLPPLISLARLSASIYRSEADYRQSLYMQGQDTLVVINGRDNGETTRVGAGAKIDVDVDGDAKFIGVSSSGLSEQRQALDSDKNYARYKAGHLIQTGKTDAESGKALQIRVGAQVATLTDIARTAAAGLEQLLKIGAAWYGENPDDVSIQPNLEFTDVELDGQNLVGIQTAKTMGLPLSQESVHNILRERGLTQYTYEEELAKLDAEGPAPGAVNNIDQIQTV